MKCPFCENKDTKVLDTRGCENNSSIKRRRFCEKCKEKFTTYEKVEICPIVVIKRDFRKEPFQKDKILNSITLACTKRSISTTEIDLIANEIENKIYSLGKKDVNSSYIGKLIIEKLKKIDEIAYIRFASVYKKFTDLNSFTEEVNFLKYDSELF